MTLRERLVRAPGRTGRIVHIALGAVVPIVFLFLDPIVFRSGGWPIVPSYLTAWRAFAYTATLVAALLVVRAATARRVSPVTSGMLYGAALVACVLGIAMLPLSLLGTLFAGIGLLGLSPFAAAWIYLRQGAHQHAVTTGRLRSHDVTSGMVLFVAIALTVQLLTYSVVRWSVAHVDNRRAVAALHTVRVLYDGDGLVRRYQAAESDDEKRRLAIAFRHLTGKDLEERLLQLLD